MLDFYKSLLKSRVLALMHGSKQLQYTASVVRTSGNISLCILIRILKLQVLKGIDLLWKSSAVYMYINQNIHDIHISHIQQFFPLPVWLWELGRYSLFQSLYLDTEYILNSKGFHILASSTLLWGFYLHILLWDSIHTALCWLLFFCKIGHKHSETSDDGS